MDSLASELESRGQAAITVELPGDDPQAGFAEYVAAIVSAMNGVEEDAVLVGHSLNCLTIPLVPSRRPLGLLVFLCGFIPVPGLSVIEQLEREPEIFAPEFDGAPARDEWERSYWPDPEEAIRVLFSDCPRGLAEWAAAQLRPQGRPPNAQLCPLEKWPAVPSAYVLGRDDRVISPDWARRAAPERLGVAPIELEGGHSLPMTDPGAVADVLIEARSTSR
jgi:pimeloyl-ACP methyl ester carboxylesterase